ncbi:MAG: hypothetical protein SPJ89_10800 [Treponema sp.]|nr:hypothetical protein [Spirochaetia bacterium]MDD7458971.1 hypothetical protein [Spirochaetales bacterium]MDY5764658.1 hypothetical protein [Treponema sp.]MDD7611654.1 hypothetical protein [Spirochaetales bacterium]MDY5812453.1 hypothetical protein [Treponema sp.]
MTILQIKNKLSDFEKDELVELIISACKINSVIKNVFSSQLGDRTDFQKLYCNFQKKLEKAFEQKDSFNINNAVKLVTQFENECTSVELISALMKDFIINAIKFSIDFGDMEESYYAKIASMLKKCLKYASSSGELLEKHLSESEEILELADKIGWCLSEEIREIYSMYFNGR